MGTNNNTNIFTCNTSNKTHLGYLSELCTNGTYDKEICIPELEEKIPFRACLGVWGLPCSVGGGGCLLTNIAYVVHMTFEMRSKTSRCLTEGFQGSHAICTPQKTGFSRGKNCPK